MKISQEDIDAANHVNLPQFLLDNGFELKKVGREYVWKEHESLYIKDNPPNERGKWYRFSEDHGGDNIAFLREFMDLSFVEAVEALNGETYDRSFEPIYQDNFSFQRKQENRPPAEIHLNENSDCKRVIAYLCKTRGLDYQLISGLIKDGKIAQETGFGNVLFKYFDESGKLVGAEKCGTSTEKKFKGIEKGSSSEYGFEVVRGKGENALFFESSIDMLSYLQMHNAELSNHRLISMMGVKPETVLSVMKRNHIPPENIYLCSDNDKAGNEFADRLRQQYPEMKRICSLKVIISKSTNPLQLPVSEMVCRKRNFMTLLSR